MGTKAVVAVEEAAWEVARAGDISRISSRASFSSVALIKTLLKKSSQTTQVAGESTVQFA